MSIAKKLLSAQEVVEGLRIGDNAVLTYLYKNYYKVVLKFISANSGSEELAQDIYQEAVIVLYENAQKPGFELSCQVQTYLYSVSKRLWLKYLKKQGRMVLLKEQFEEDGFDVSEAMELYSEREAEFEKMSRSLVELGEPCATLIKDFYIEKLSMEEIAIKFGYTNADNAKNQKYKCLQRLRKYFFDRTAIEQE
jgi:RNA polymerase sigma factor (sigma-70 family)